MREHLSNVQDLVLEAFTEPSDDGRPGAGLPLTSEVPHLAERGRTAVTVLGDEVVDEAVDPRLPALLRRVAVQGALGGVEVVALDESAGRPSRASLAEDGAVTATWQPRPELWTLVPAVLHLDHGSRGAVPRRAQETAARLRAESEANPPAWFRSLGARVDGARRSLARWAGADDDGFALVPNVSAGVTVAFATRRR